MIKMRLQESSSASLQSIAVNSSAGGLHLINPIC